MAVSPDWLKLDQNLAHSCVSGRTATNKGKKPQIVYRRIDDVQVVGTPNRLRSRTHKAFYRYNKEGILVYLDSGQGILWRSR